jgi:hypothetical protein
MDRTTMVGKFALTSSGHVPKTLDIGEKLRARRRREGASKPSAKLYLTKTLLILGRR